MKNNKNIIQLMHMEVSDLGLATVNVGSTSITTIAKEEDDKGYTDSIILKVVSGECVVEVNSERYGMDVLEEPITFKVLEVLPPYKNRKLLMQALETVNAHKEEEEEWIFDDE